MAYFGEPGHAPGRVLRKLNDIWTEAMVRHPSYLMTSYAGYTLRAR